MGKLTDLMGTLPPSNQGICRHCGDWTSRGPDDYCDRCAPMARDHAAMEAWRGHGFDVVTVPDPTGLVYVVKMNSREWGPFDDPAEAVLAADKALKAEWGVGK